MKMMTKKLKMDRVKVDSFSQFAVLKRNNRCANKMRKLEKISTLKLRVMMKGRFLPGRGRIIEKEAKRSRQSKKLYSNNKLLRRLMIESKLSLLVMNGISI